MYIHTQMNITDRSFAQGTDPPMGARLHRVAELTKEAPNGRIR